MEGNNETSNNNSKNKINKLEASNQQLEASNQQLKATEQQLRAANQQLRASEGKIKASNQQLLELKQAIEVAVDGITVTDIGGKVVFVNQSWAKMHGYSPEEILGKHLSIFHTPEQLKTDVQAGMEQVMKEGAWAGEVGHVRRDGTTFPTYMSTALLKDAGGKPARLIGVARDITEQKRRKRNC